MSSIAFEELAALRARTQGQKTFVSIEGRDSVPAVVATATPGDHHQIHNLLMNVLRAPSAAEFQAQLEEPTYEPINRLIVKRSRQVVAHCRIIDRAVTFGPIHLVVSELADVATGAEFRGQGYASALIQTAEQRIEQDGAQVGLLTTDSPEFFRRLGWIEAVHQGHSKARARDILAELSAAEAQRPTPSLLAKADETEALSIRLWRHVELDALMSIYRNNLSGSYGRTLRTEAFWRWLITRRGFDRILVAIQGSSKLQLDESPKRIEGYAAMCGSRIVELMASGPRQEEVRRKLLARACREAIERDDEVVQFDAAPNDGMHRLMLEAGGNYYSHDQDRGMVTMAKSTLR